MSLFQQAQISTGNHSFTSGDNIAYANFAAPSSPPSSVSNSLHSNSSTPLPFPPSPPLRKSTRVCHTPPYLKDYVYSSAITKPDSDIPKVSPTELHMGYISSKNDYSLFTKSSSSSITVIAVYVDDILLAGDDVTELDSLKSFLDFQFKIKDLGYVHNILGLEVLKTHQGHLVSQHKFASDLLNEFNCYHFTLVVTPLESSVKLTPDMGQPLTDPILYRRLVGKLIFLQHTRPDIAFSVQHLSQFLQAPQVPHMLAALHVLRYLLNNLGQGILLSITSDTSLVAYADSDWAAYTQSRKYITGVFINFGGCPISWKCKKQPTISLSSIEAEYIALRKVVAEVSWLVRLYGDLGLVFSSPIQSGLISLHHISTADQPADILTKSIVGPLHCHLLGKLGVASPSSLRGSVGLNNSSTTRPISEINQ
nr:uncharacterized mitochondrial protein AtMg00810-like [Nicotiana tomentosiformis]